VSAKHCPDCKIAFPEKNAAGNPPPEECPRCGKSLAEYKGDLKRAGKPKGEVDLTVEFTDSVGDEERRLVLQALQQTEEVKRTGINDLEPPEEVYIK
jgi:hypothetical protein